MAPKSVWHDKSHSLWPWLYFFPFSLHFTRLIKKKKELKGWEQQCRWATQLQLSQHEAARAVASTLTTQRVWGALLSWPLSGFISVFSQANTRDLPKMSVKGLYLWEIVPLKFTSCAECYHECRRSRLCDRRGVGGCDCEITPFTFPNCSSSASHFYFVVISRAALLVSPATVPSTFRGDGGGGGRLHALPVKVKQWRQLWKLVVRQWLNANCSCWKGFWDYALPTWWGSR